MRDRDSTSSLLLAVLVSVGVGLSVWAAYQVAHAPEPVEPPAVKPVAPPLPTRSCGSGTRVMAG
jgi:hypothetical protein